MTRPISELRTKSSDANTFSLCFNAATATPRITIPKHASFDSLTSLTVEAWIKPNIPTYAARVVDYMSGNNGFGLYLTTSGSIQPSVGNGAIVTPTSTLKINVASWNHVAFTWNGSSIVMFINGKLSNSSPQVGGNTGSGGTTLYIGNRAASDRAFVGLLQEIRISNTVRYTADFDVPTAPFEYDANTILLTHLDEGTGTTITDSTPLAHVGTLEGTTLPLWSGGKLKKAGTVERLSVV